MSVPVPLIAIGGPTGAGKSSLAVKLAQTFRGEIINCDSLQVYRHFDIGTAKLSEAERGGIRHHLIDVAEPGESFTAGDFSRLARAALAEIAAYGRVPIVAGGTGFYLRAMIDGLSPGPSRDVGLRQKLAAREARRPGALHRILTRLDPPSAARIHARDLPKLIRAIEIRILSRQNPSQQRPREFLQGYSVLKLALFPSRDELYRVLDARCDQMLSGGLLEETRQIVDLGIPRDARAFLSLGYKETLAILDGRLDRESAREQMKRDTRRYAKRQMTWFRNDPGWTGLAGFGSEPRIYDAAAEVLSSFLRAVAAGETTWQN